MIGQTGHKIKSVDEGSIAAQLQVKPGDILLSIDGKEIKDILDYRFLINAESYVMLIQKPDGEEWELDIESDYEDPGLNFEDGIMSNYLSCHNKCIFCFIDQMPKGMRETLYFKDDDSRLSFLQGNYVTLTNMKEEDVDRIISYRLEPINISVHTTDPELRCRMLNNRFAGDSLRYIDKLYDAGITMNAQIVLCPGWNDGENLRRTLKDMLRWAPVMESVSVVPIGLTRFREGLTQIEPVSKEKAIETIGIIREVQKLALENFDIHFVHASDELYMLAGYELPSESEYDGYLQLENGVGMLRLLIEETRDAIEDLTESDEEEKVTIATGKLAFGVIKMLADEITSRLPKIDIQVVSIENDFFGPMITVSGLITGSDIIKQLKGRELGDRLILPVNMFRSNEEVFLDDVTKSDIENELGIKVTVTGSSGYDFVAGIVYRDYSLENAHEYYNHYELGEVEDE